MKKSIIIAAISAASAILLAASCQKQAEPELKNEGKTFTAVISQELTKTTITSAYKVNWEAGDQIDINQGTTYSATPSASDATRASFTKVSGSDPTPEYTAVYPASLFKNPRYELPATQTYAAGKFNAPMCAYGSTETLKFQNMCGVLCFALKGTDKVRSIVVTANEQLCGPFEFTTAPAFGFTGENEGNTVTLDCGTEGIQLDESTATDFYIYLPPTTYTAGMKIVVTSTEGKTFEKTTTKSVEIVRNKIYTFNWTPFTPALPSGALPGVFSVGATKKVYFSKGNLWATQSPDKDELYFEENQYSSKSDWDPTHVSLLTWSSTVQDAANSCYSGEYLFCDVNHKVSVDGGEAIYYALSLDEWKYLINKDGNENIRKDKFKYGVTVCGKANCLILAPDDFEGTIAASYDASTWATAEAAGLVCLPAAGFRSNTLFDKEGYNGYYWSSNKNQYEEHRAYWGVYFDSSNVGLGGESTDSNFRDFGYSIRLVTEVK